MYQEDIPFQVRQKRHARRREGYTRTVKRVASRLLQWLGVDRAVIMVASVRGWQLLAGPVTVFFIAHFLSSEQQGFYYTFGSILALQFVGEMGLSFVLGQFASHEFVHLHWSPKGQVEGDPVSLGRFMDLLFKSSAWYGVGAMLLVVVLFPVGLLFFGQKDAARISVDWRLPWVLAVIAASLNMLTLPLLAVIEGSGEVAKVNLVRLMQSVSSSLAVWVTLLFRGGLFAVPLSMFSMVAVGLGWILWEKPKLLKQLLLERLAPSAKREQCGALSWRHEVWPMQWRFAITVVSGYFTYQLLTPVLFYYHGPVVAGQIGMTMAVVNAIYFVALAWVSARVPRFGGLIARRDWIGLDTLFSQVFKRSLGVVSAGACGVLGLLWLLQQYFPIGQRFLPAPQIALLMGAAVADLVINAIALYLRAHKKEPLMWLSVGTAILRGLSIWLLGKYLSSLGVAVAILAVNVFYGLPLNIGIWLKLRRKWHGEPATS